MRNIFYKIFFILLFFSATLMVNAQGETEVQIFPRIIDEQVKARDLLKYDIVIKNVSDKKVDIYPVVNDISMTDGRQEFLDPAKMDKATSLARWIKFKRGLIDLMPAEEMTIPLEINVNLLAKPGKYYAIIAFPQGPNRKEAEDSMLNVSYPQLMINIEVEEQIIEKAQIKNFKSVKNIFLKWPVSFNLEVENFGNREINPIGAIYIYNRGGKEVDKIDINQAQEKVSPGESKQLILEWTTGKGFGKFKAKLEVEYGQYDKRDLQDTIYFWMLPWWLLIITGGGFLLALVLVIIMFKKTYSAHKLSYPDKHSSLDGVINLRDKNKK